MRSAFVVVVALLALAIVAGRGRAEAFESFTLERDDQLIAEAPGCEAECRATDGARLCTFKDPACRAVCRTLPQCKPDGERPIKVCAVVRGRD